MSQSKYVLAWVIISVGNCWPSTEAAFLMSSPNVLNPPLEFLKPFTKPVINNLSRARVNAT